MSNNVNIIGVGAHKCGRFPDETFQDVGRFAVQAALEDADISYTDIQRAFCARVFLPPVTGMKVLLQFGRSGIPVEDIEAACASSGAALKTACNSIRSGDCDIALAFGVEKMPGGFLPPPNYNKWQVNTGLIQNPMYWALNATRHMHDYGTTIEQIAKVAYKNHKNGVYNPNAMYQKEFSMEEILNSKLVCDPMRLFMICTPNEGSAAFILCSDKVVKRFKTKPITIAAIEHRISQNPIKQVAAYCFHDFDHPSATTAAANAAYTAAGLGPKDIDVAEVQDTDAFCEMEAYEHLGFCKIGESGKLVDEGTTEIGGRIPVNTSGGLISNGEPVGASGLRQLYDLVVQLRGQAKQRQVENAKVALGHVYGADGHSAVAILKK